MRTITCPLHLSKGSCNALVHCRELFMLPHTRYPSQHIFWWMVRLCADKAFLKPSLSALFLCNSLALPWQKVIGPDRFKGSLTMPVSGSTELLPPSCSQEGLRRSPYTISLIKLTECTMISGLAKSNLPQVHYGRGIESMGMHLLILDREYVIFTTINE